MYVHIGRLKFASLASMVAVLHTILCLTHGISQECPVEQKKNQVHKVNQDFKTTKDFSQFTKTAYPTLPLIRKILELVQRPSDLRQHTQHKRTPWQIVSTVSYYHGSAQRLSLQSCRLTGIRHIAFWTPSLN